MKKLILTALGAMMLAVPAMQAQNVDRAKLVSAVEKSDLEVQDVKKGAKAATWLKRAQAYYNAVYAPAKECYEGMPAELLKMKLGAPKSEGTAQLSGPLEGPAEVYEYNLLTVYLRNGQVIAWPAKKDMVKDAYAQMMNSLEQAYKLDPKQASKIKAEISKIGTYYVACGNTNYDVGNYVAAADAYRKAYNAQLHPAYNEAPQTQLIYNAGYLLTIDGMTNPASYAEGETCLNEAIAKGYAADGQAYYYLYFCYSGQAQQAEGEAKAELLGKAKATLMEGIAAYPANENLIAGLLDLYNREPSMGSPAELTDMIKAAIERDPESISMWSCLALANFQMKNYDEAIAAGEKVVELTPDAFDSNYRLGIFHASKADAIQEQMNQTTYTRQSEYDADLARSNASYRDAAPYLEKALLASPDNKGLIETLRSIYFRLRDEEGMMDKYNEYNALWQQL